MVKNQGSIFSLRSKISTLLLRNSMTIFFSPFHTATPTEQLKQVLAVRRHIQYTAKS